MKKKLFTIFGPLVVAMVAIFALKHMSFDVTPKVRQEASTSLTQPIISGQVIKNESLDDPTYAPFFGSSELNRIDLFHPSVLAEKYHRPYRPFLLGSAGTQSLTQYLIVSSLPTQLKDRKAVFIISPQWFVPDGVSEQYFDHWYSPVQMYSWLTQLANKKSFSEDERYYAKRALTFKVINSKEELKTILNKIQKNQALNDEEKANIKRNYESLYREDRLFSRLGLTNKNQVKIQKRLPILPNTYNYNRMYAMAGRIARKETNNNKFEIQNGFYTTRLRNTIKDLKNSQRNIDYRYSPEYSDLELVLNQFAKNNTDVLFIIPPVNDKWSNYTGLSQEMLKQTATKIEYQLKSQGFNNVMNLTNQDKVQYFMNDTIHLGWRGWLEVDRGVKPFLESPYQKPNYRIDSKFYDDSWQEMNPKDIK